MTSDRDLLARWAAEELFAAGGADEPLRRVHRARGEFYFEALRELPPPATASLAAHGGDPLNMGRLLALVLSVSGRSAEGEGR